MSGGPFEGLGPVLVSLRTDRRLTQEALAQRAGVTKAMLSNYECGKQRPHLDTLERLLNALRVSLGQLATRLERYGDRDGAEDDHVVVDRLLDALEGAQAAAQEAGEEELARALVHLSNLLAIGWQGRAVVALAELIEEARAALRRTEPGGEAQDA